MTSIPAICNNPACGTIWITNSLFKIGPNATVAITGCIVYGCPRCGGAGAIPDGAYKSTSAFLWNQEQFDVIFSAVKAVHHVALRAKSVGEVEKEIESHPVLSHMKGFIPKDLKDLAILLGILYATIAFCQNYYQGKSQPDIQVNKDVYGILEAIYDSLPDSGKPETDDQAEREQ